MAGTRYLEQAPILVAEVTAVRDGLKSALEAGYRHIEVEGDNQVVIHALQGKITPPWQIAPIIEDIRNLSAGVTDISFHHIYREGNRAADWMAKIGSTRPLDQHRLLYSHLHLLGFFFLFLLMTIWVDLL